MFIFFSGDELDRSRYIIEEDSLTISQSHLECENEGSSTSESETDSESEISSKKQRNHISRSYDITIEEKDDDSESCASSSCSSTTSDDDNNDDNGRNKKKFSKVFTVNPDNDDVDSDVEISEIACLDSDLTNTTDIVLLSCTTDVNDAPLAENSGVGIVDDSRGGLTALSGVTQNSLLPANGTTTSLQQHVGANTKYKSFVMITQTPEESSLVNVVTSETTKVTHDVTVRHTNDEINDISDISDINDINDISDISDQVQVVNMKIASDGNKVRVLSGDQLSQVICLEEGLADDDSWVEDVGSHDDDEDFATTTATESDSGGEDALMAMLLSQQSDREEELRGYHRQAIDFTLFTIAEESCEESETECKPQPKQRPLSSSELEKYFFFGLCGDGANQPSSNQVPSSNLDEASETSSVYSEGVDSITNDDDVNSGNTEESQERLASSRLEKYFLTGFMGFTERRESDGSGSVGSDSEGRPSPEQRRKRLVRARGTGRSSHSSSLDNLLVDQNTEVEPQLLVNSVSDLVQQQSSQDSSETDEGGNVDEGAISFDKDGTFDTVKRKQKHAKKTKHENNDDIDHKDDDDTLPQPEFLNMTPTDLAISRNKQHSRDSGFIGSCDDLLKEQKGNQ